MVVFVLETVPTSLRGEMTRWMLEVHPGVFIGTVSAMVRDKLWEHACERSKGGHCTLIQSAANEQGFTMRFWGKTRRYPIDYDGLSLVMRPNST